MEKKLIHLCTQLNFAKKKHDGKNVQFFQKYLKFGDVLNMSLHEQQNVW